MILVAGLAPREFEFPSPGEGPGRAHFISLLRSMMAHRSLPDSFPLEHCRVCTANPALLTFGKWVNPRKAELDLAWRCRGSARLCTLPSGSRFRISFIVPHCHCGVHSGHAWCTHCACEWCTLPIPSRNSPTVLGTLQECGALPLCVARAPAACRAHSLAVACTLATCRMSVVHTHPESRTPAGQQDGHEQPLQAVRRLAAAPP